jgi:predicted RNase H-like HicB family nuclease
VPIPNKIHAVVFSEGDWFVAQCLEYDIATQAKSVSALIDEVEQIIAAHILVAEEKEVEPFANVPRAPGRFWRMYKDAKAKLEPVHQGELRDDRSPVLELRAA